MRHILTLTLILLSTFCRADIATEPWPKKLRDFPEKSEALNIREFKITARESSDQSGAGTGGHIYDIAVQNTRSGVKLALREQSIAIAVLELYRGWPQFEIWGRAGGGVWCRSLYRFTGSNYEYVRTDEFVVNVTRAKDKTRTTTMPNSEDVIYFVETRIPQPRK